MLSTYIKGYRTECKSKCSSFVCVKQTLDILELNNAN